MRYKRYHTIVLVVATVLCMGGTCRQEVGQSTADTFFSTLAEIIAQGVADALVGGGL